MSRIVESLYRISGINLNESISINDSLYITIPAGTIIDTKHNNYEYNISDKIFIGSIPIKNLKGKNYFLDRIKSLIKNNKAVHNNMCSFTWSRLLDSDLINNIEVEWDENKHLPLGKFIESKKEFLDSSGLTNAGKNFEEEFINPDYKSLEYNPFTGLIRIYFDGENGWYEVDNRISSEDLFNEIINFLNEYNIKYKINKKQLYNGESKVIDIKVTPRVFFGKSDIRKL